MCLLRLWSSRNGPLLFPQISHEKLRFRVVDEDGDGGDGGCEGSEGRGEGGKPGREDIMKDVPKQARKERTDGKRGVPLRSFRSTVDSVV